MGHCGIKDQVLLEDLEIIASKELFQEGFRDKTFTITGATGLVGSQIAKALMVMNELHGTNIMVHAVVRSEAKTRSVYGEMFANPQLDFVYVDDLEALVLPTDTNFLIHAASPTNSQFFITNPVETLKTAVQGSLSVLDGARAADALESVVYLSSMEAFGVVDSGEGRSTETQLGYIDLTNIRSCYPESKRLCECMCKSYADEYQLPVKIARLSQTFGAGVPSDDNRVFSQFAKSAMQGKDIVMHTEGKSLGNYTYTRDAVEAIFLILLRGSDGETYSVANETTTTSIRDMAQLVVQEFGNGNSQVVFDISEKNNSKYAPDVKLRISSQKLQNLGWVPTVGLKEAYERLIRSFEQS